MSDIEIQKNRARNKLINMRYGDAEPMDEFNKRNQVRNLLRSKEVRNFYSDVQIKLRSISGATTIVIPEEAEDSITELVKQYSALYSEVLMVPIGITGRVTISVDDAKTFWGNTVDVVGDLNTTLSDIELSDNKLSCHTSISNSTLEDSLINMTIYIEDLLARAIAYGFDHGVINGVGDGTSIFEPRGILVSLPELNKVTFPTGSLDQYAASSGHILSEIFRITSGTKDDIGEVIAVMKRKTYYKIAAAGANSSLPYPNLNGVRVKFTPAVANDTIILGDFKQYLMGKRNGIHISSSEHAHFIENQTAFKVVSRFDGKPINTAAFVEITNA